MIKTMKTILIEGDSTAYGYFAGERGAWPDQLKQMKIAQGIGDILESTMVVSLAYPGLSQSYINRGVLQHAQQYSDLGPMVIASQVGLNEAKIFPPQTRPLVSPGMFAAQLSRFCDIAHGVGAVPMLVGQAPVDESRHLPTISGAVLKDGVIAEYSEVMREVAAQQDGIFVDVRASFANSGHDLRELVSEVDGSHPNGWGHLVIAQAVDAALPPGF
jgi:lysophospholipase L1-like esterase